MRLASVDAIELGGERRPRRPPLLPRRRRRRARQREARACAAHRPAGRRGRAPDPPLPGRRDRRRRRARLEEPIETSFYGRPVAGRVVEGPWDEALSELAGKPLRLVRTEREGDGHDRGPSAGASLVSTGSLDALEPPRAWTQPVDGRRFRMTIGIDGVGAARGGRLDRRAGARRRARSCSCAATSAAAPSRRSIPDTASATSTRWARSRVPRRRPDG